MSTCYPPYKSSSNNIKVELDLANYATKDDVKNITHVDVSSFASKTNLAALKTEVDKINANKLKTVPVDLAKLRNVVNNDVVKRTDYNTKVTSKESQIAGVTKNTLDNLGDITKRKAVDTNNFVLKTKLASDVTTDITAIKNDYVTNTSLTSQLNDLKSQHIATEVTTIDNKTKKNVSDILELKSKLQQKEYTINENERSNSSARGLFFYIDQSYLVYNCKLGSFNYAAGKITT